ncbi:MAG: GNAT family N-acetyltransferase [Sulfobacillus sp.]
MSLRVVVSTNRIFLRQFTDGDAENLFELDGDPEVLRYVVNQQGTLGDYHERIRQYRNQYEEEGGHFGFWAAIEKSSHEFIGWFHLRKTLIEGQAELGYRLKQSKWGKGYASEMAIALVGWAFEEMTVQSVVASALVDNLRSIRVMQKSGMQWVQNYFYQAPDGTRYPAVKYGIRRESFKKGT